MRILAIADRPPQKSILKTIKTYNIELICTLGDLSYSDLAELELINHIPKIGVYGNHDSGTYFEPLGIKNLHLNTFIFKEIKFGGFQGCVRYKPNPNAIMYTQEEAQEMLKEFPCVDVFISHAPPFGINDEPNEISHQGFKALNQYINRCQPKYFLHGHTYPDSPIEKVNNTKIIYVYEDKILDLDF